jgi:hypothetical protein
MKKILLVLILVVVFSGAAFADHPDNQLGIGVMFRWGDSLFEKGATHYAGAALSLKVPSIPIFWGINMSFGSNHFGLGVTGDKYFMEGALVPDINLHYFIGLGGWVNMWGFSDSFGLSFGARLPIGISWHLVDMIEIFLDVAPSLGIRVTPGFEFPAGGLPIELGFRIWL